MNIDHSLIKKWNFYMKDCNSPQTFIDMGFYGMILASLQRRVWLGTEHSPLFPNEYIVLIGPPSVGKGRVLGPIGNVLRHHTKTALAAKQDPAYVAANLVISNYAESEEYKAVMAAASYADVITQHLIPLAADATTYEALMKAMVLSFRNMKIKRVLPDGRLIDSHYGHKSLAFCLDEISSLWNKDSEKTTRFLLNAYDCGQYTYATKGQGTDVIKDLCLNFLGGTTPEFMRESADTRILGSGLTSRIIFVYEHLPRGNKFGPITHSPEQLAAYQDILDHVLTLASLYGQIKFSAKDTPEAFEVLRHYFEEVLPVQRVNPNPQLDPYYGRKNIHAQKLACAVHFSYSTEMELYPQDCRLALAILNELEVRMHYALQFGKNPLSHIMHYIMSVLRETKCPVTREFLDNELIFEGRDDEITESLETLKRTGRITYEPKTGKYAATNKIKGRL